MIAPMELPATLRLLPWRAATRKPDRHHAQLDGNAIAHQPQQTTEGGKRGECPRQSSPRQALDHARMPMSIMCRAPNRSTNHPATDTCGVATVKILTSSA